MQWTLLGFVITLAVLCLMEAFGAGSQMKTNKKA